MERVKRNNKSNLLYPELSYEIIGVAFNVFNELGFGHREIYYQRALSKELNRAGIEYEREVRHDVTYKGDRIGVDIADFIVENKIVVELKARSRIGYVHIKQTLSYLKENELKLEILIYFTKDGVKYRRVLNAQNL